jgi:hypothetical protein
MDTVIVPSDSNLPYPNGYSGDGGRIEKMRVNKVTKSAMRSGDANQVITMMTSQGTHHSVNDRHLPPTQRCLDTFARKIRIYIPHRRTETYQPAPPFRIVKPTLAHKPTNVTRDPGSPVAPTQNRKHISKRTSLIK